MRARTATAVSPEAEIGVIGIRASSSPLDDAEHVEVETPYGKPSSEIAIGEIEGKRSRSCSDRLRTLLRAAIPRIGPQPEDACATALARARM
jgi:purine nucleoside phosphorylase